MAPATRRFDAVLFDAGGVLVLPDPTVLGPLLSPFGGSMDVERHRRAHYAGMAAKSRADSAEHDWAAYNEVYVTTVGVEAEHVDHAAEVLDQTRTAHLWRWPVPETLRALAVLSRAGVPMGVVSNASGQIEAELRRSGICQAGPGTGVRMRVVVDSHVVGVAKPDPAIFDHALPHFAEIERSRILYVGDSVVMDVVSATGAGLHPVLVDPYDDHVGAEFERIRSVEAVVDWC
jgi:FMN phosphatase YigB (HAD superfamily)